MCVCVWGGGGGGGGGGEGGDELPRQKISFPVSLKHFCRLIFDVREADTFFL